MTSPDKPDTVAPQAGSAGEERTVATPAVDSTAATAAVDKAAVDTSAAGGSASAGKPAAGTTTVGKTAVGKSAGNSAANAGPAKPVVRSGTVAGTVSGTTGGTNGVHGHGRGEPESAAPTVITSPVGKPPPLPPVEGPEVTSSAPPPWQRVASDTQYIAGHDHPADDTTSPQFGNWGYQRSPRSEAYGQTETVGSLAGEYPVVSGTAAASVFAAAAGQSGVLPDARPGTDPTGRTTVNFGVPPADPMRPPAAASAPSALRRPGRGPRRASLQVKRIDPWSVLKLAFVLSVALFFVWLVAVGVLYGVLDGMGVWDRVNGTYNEFASNTPGGGGGPLITASRVFGIAAVIGAINIVLFTALATVGSFVYNVSADLAGGLEITLAERE